MTIRSGSSLHTDEGAQSMVELALVLPLLLVIVIGLMDVGRIYASAIAATNAARGAASLAARDPHATLNAICQRARDELAAATAPDPCATAPIAVTCVRDGAACGNDAGVVLAQSSAGANVAVTVSYQVDLLAGYLVGRAFSVNPITVSGHAAFAGLSE